VKIAAARVKPVRLQFARPVGTARGVVDSRASVILELADSDGHAGYGEAAPWPGFGTEREAEALAALEEVARSMRGIDLVPGPLPAALAGRLLDAPAARAAVQAALWDLAARRAGRPLADHLAQELGQRCGGVLREVAVSALLVGLTPDALRAEAARARAAGHRAAKIKLGTAALDEDLQRARAAREGLGPDVRLRGDANGAWSMAQAHNALAALAQFGFDFVEQPLPAGDIAGLAALRGRTPVRIAADESVAAEEGALRLIDTGAADVFVLKPAMLGGPARALEIAAHARQAGCEVVFTHAFESAIGAHHALHCAAAWGDADAVHGLGTAGLFVKDIAEPVACRNGMAALTDAPGIGSQPVTGAGP
jgi:o-succinylbenzoate synthase